MLATIADQLCITLDACGMYSERIEYEYRTIEKGGHEWVPLAAAADVVRAHGIECVEEGNEDGAVRAINVLAHVLSLYNPRSRVR